MNTLKICGILLILLKLFAGKYSQTNENVEIKCNEEKAQGQCTKTTKIEVPHGKNEKTDLTTKEYLTCVKYTFCLIQPNIQNLIQKHQHYFLKEQKSSLLYFKNSHDDGDELLCPLNQNNENSSERQRAIYGISLMNTMPIFQGVDKEKNNVQIFNLNILRQHLELTKALNVFESKSVQYKLRQIFFMPEQVEMHPKIPKLMNSEKQVLSLFQQKKDSGDCILYLQYTDSEFDYFFLQIKDDFHFDYVEVKTQNDFSQLNPLQQAIKRAQKAYMLALPSNLMNLDNQRCAIHSFGFVSSFKPFISYAHIGYIICADTIFDAMFGLEDSSQNSQLRAYTFEEILSKSEKLHNFEANNRKRFTYQSVIQIKQIVAYISLVLQDQISAMVKGAQFKEKENGREEEIIFQDSIHQYSLFKIITTFDINTRLTLFKVQTIEEILEENFAQNASILKLALQFIKEIEEGKIKKFPDEYESFKKVVDENENFVEIEMTDNLLVLGMDKLHKLWYSILKFLINLF